MTVPPEALIEAAARLLCPSESHLAMADACAILSALRAQNLIYFAEELEPTYAPAVFGYAPLYRLKEQR